MNIGRAFYKCRPGATFTHGANEHSLEMLNSRYDGEDKVTQEELDAAWIIIQEEDRASAHVEPRMAKYKKKSDPLFMEWQYLKEIGDSGADAARTKWMNEVAKIRQSHPKP